MRNQIRFIGTSRLAVLGALLPFAVAFACSEGSASGPAASSRPEIKMTSWNRASTRFIDPPAFTWAAVPGAHHYQVTWKTSGPGERREQSEAPAFDFARVWTTTPMGKVEWSAAALDARGAAIAETGPRMFHRVPDFDGKTEPAMDWAAAAHKNLMHILDLPKDPRTGEPWWITHSWHNPDPEGQAVAYPSLHYPSFVMLFLEALRHEPAPEMQRRLREAIAAVSVAMLRDRTADGGVAGGMPLTTRIVYNPKHAPDAEKGAITTFRAARMGEALLALHEWKPDPKMLAYAEHIAAVLAKLQRPDGSWPYRVDPGTGKVIEAYTSAGITTVAFFERLMRVAGHKKYADTVARCVRWTMENPVRTLRWQGMYEDVPETPAFANLENWDTLDAIRYMLAHRAEITDSVPTAVRLNRWIEDQFVIFGEADMPEYAHCPVPLTMEQYACYAPMEVHTARWIEALLALKDATGKDEYLVKARRAANAIVREQKTDGRLSTWGLDTRTGKTYDEGDWYGCNAVADVVLYRMATR